ncbi:isoprenoid synthase domain-containing protein [Desarmillaria tabescens]|uniref:(2E,6E)-farnesyl diphosphate synthase n=1 Tax=Armillaria tabescens TaxID=1929756 RepID=A0AA39JWX4_ARMTA|nr:isoprenoid synthase domain-containing protein [Desarmillaria tabescens]KAK0450427.1 isoprenoid synthase domain-containing protein [Desarmillaria tabescens]
MRGWPVSIARTVIPFPTPPPCRNLLPKRALTTRPDPFLLVSDQLAQVRGALFDLLGSSSPALDEIAKYYFLQPSKQLRPLIILLLAQATNGLGKNWNQKRQEGIQDLDLPLSRPDVLNDFNPSIPTKTSPFSQKWDLHPPTTTTPTPTPNPLLLLPTQTRLAQIVEMIHAASLLHDDVIDESPLRRGVPSAPHAYGSKLSVLGGNFILGRASAALARLGDPEVVELIASIISNLVEGEILQMKEAPAPANAWRVYLQKTYMKTASLMAKGARGAVVLGGCVEGEVYREVAYAYGRNLGIAFQLVDDILDYEAGEATLGKPGGADLQLGLATGPALFAWEEHPEIGPLIERKFAQPGDVELARDYVRKSSGVERTRDLALAYAKQARDVLAPLPDSDAKGALEALTERVVKRKS